MRGARARSIAPASSRSRKALLAENVPAGADLSSIPEYDDECWQFDALVMRENASPNHARVNFAGQTYKSIKPQLKEILFARLNYTIPRARKRLPVSGVATYASKVGTFLRFFALRGGADLYRNIDREDAAALVAWLEEQGTSQDRIRDICDALADVEFYAHYLNTVSVTFDVRKFIRLRLGAEKRRGENTTPRIPSEVIHPLLHWSMRYITEFAPDILAARSHWDELLAESEGMYRSDERLPILEQRARRRARLASYLQELEVAGRPVPVWGDVWMRRNAGAKSKWALEHPVDCVFLDAVAGIPKAISFREGIRTRQFWREAVEATIQRVGVEVGGLVPRPHNLAETGQPWRSGLDSKTLRHEQHMLLAACYVVCAYLTGMRDSEIQAMEVGCVRRGWSRDGLVERFYLTSRVYKNRGLTGDCETWVTIEPVARAVEIMEQLSAPIRAERGGNTIWRALAHGNRQKEHISHHINGILNLYVAHLNELFGDVIPLVEGDTWQVSTQQFRRTVAWHIANRPHGLVAGMLQFKHLSVAMFEGYAGQSESNFPQEIEAERVLSRIEDLLSYYEARRAGEVFGGGAAKRVHGELDKLIGQFVGVVADEARLRAMLAHPARTLHVGILADCFYDPSQALCVAAGTSSPTPLSFLCQPTKCSNACIAAKHRPRWEAELERAQRMLKGGKRLGSLQKASLRREIKKIERVLAEAADPSHAGASSEGLLQRSE